MKALVIGSEGNIGRPLVEHLRSVGWDVRTADILPRWRPDYLMADINSPLDLLPAFDWRPDVVYLLAAVVSRVTCEQATSLTFATNLGGVANVAQLCLRSGARLVYTSTSEVYGPTDGVMDETATPHPNNAYGLSKYLSEGIVTYLAEQHGLQAVILRPFMIYGEGETQGDHRSAMIRFASDLAAGRQITVHCDTSRAWLHVQDAVRAFEAAGTRREAVGKIINIGHPDTIDTWELADMIRDELWASPGLIRVKSQPERMTAHKYPRLDRQKDLLGFAPTISVAEGVVRVCAAVKR